MQVLELWNKFSKFPGGRFLFSKFLGSFVPYTGSVHPEVLELSAGYAKVRIRDRKAHRNHLESIHAVALMNSAEIASGLALMTAIPKDARGILKSFSIDFSKKARGSLTSEAQQTPITSNEKKDYKIEVEVKDSSGDVVCSASALWRVGPKKS